MPKNLLMNIFNDFHIYLFYQKKGKGSPFKNYLYIPEFLKNEIFHQISQKHISSNELDYMHFCGLYDA